MNSVKKREFWGRRTLCVVTGASQGIGRSFAIAFSKRFAPESTVVLLARSMTGLHETRQLISEACPGVQVKVCSVDLSEPDIGVLERVLDEACRGGSHFELALLVHNAGSIGKGGERAGKMDNAQHWNRYMSLNLYSVTMLTSVFLKLFPSPSLSCHRCVVNVTSLCAIQPFKGLVSYCVGKASREMFFKVLAQEEPSLEILNYSPGPVNTDMITDVIRSVSDDETRAMFTSMKEKRTLVTLEQTTERIMAVLADGSFKTGDRVDYFNK